MSFRISNCIFCLHQQSNQFPVDDFFVVGINSTRNEWDLFVTYPLQGFPDCPLLVGGITSLMIAPLMRCENCTNFWGPESQDLFVHVFPPVERINLNLGLSDFIEIWWKCSSNKIFFRGIQMLDTFGKKILLVDFLRNQYRKSLTHFVSLLSSEWYSPVCLDIHSNTRAINSVEKRLSDRPVLKPCR